MSDEQEPAGTALSPAGLRHVEDVLAATRNELGRVESKASLLASSAGVVVGALLAGIIAGDWTPFRLANAVEWLWWLGAGVGGVGFVMLGDALYPRLRRSERRSIAYFHDVAVTPSAELMAAIEASAQARADVLLSQLRDLAESVDLKYRRIRWSLLSFTISAGLIMISLFVSLLITI